jgi:hypothetical protein
MNVRLELINPMIPNILDSEDISVASCWVRNLTITFGCLIFSIFIVHPKLYPNEPNVKSKSRSSFESGCKHHFAGLHASGSGNSEELSGTFIIFLDDFPKIKAQYNKYETLTSQFKFYKQALDHLMNEHKSFVVNAISEDETLATLHQKKAELEVALRNTSNLIQSQAQRIKDSFEPLKSEMIKSIDESPDLDFGVEKQREFEQAKRMFGSI